MFTLYRARPASPLRRSARLISKQEANSSRKRDSSPSEPGPSTKKQKGKVTSDSETVSDSTSKDHSESIDSKRSIKRKAADSPSNRKGKQPAKKGTSSKKGKTAKSSNKRYNSVH